MAIFTGIAAAFTAISSWTIGTFAAGAFLLQTAAGIGLNLLASAIAGKPDKPSFSVQGQLQSGGDVARSFILGRTATAGSLVYANTWGNAGKTPNAYFTQVIALSDLPTQGLGTVWINGEPCTLLPDQSHAEYGVPVQEYRKDGKDYLWVKFYDGTQTQADNFLTSRVSSAERPYQSTRVGYGVSYVICTARIHEELFTGFPQYKFELVGAKLYDPSLDSSVGGNGTQRLADPATWGGDGDHLPAVQVYNLLLGFKYAGSWFYGVQNMASARLPAADWIAQINKCRAQVAAPGGGTEVQYQSGLEIQVNAQLADAIEALATACQGRLIETGGTYKMRLGAPDLPVASFTDGDILSTESQSFTPFFGLADTINGIAATYPDPAEGWNAKAAPSLFRPDLEIKAGNRRLMADVSLGAVYRPTQVQRLMKSALEEAQRARRHTFSLPPHFWTLEPGDYVEWTSVRNGYVTKLFRVDGIVDKANLDVVVDLTEVDPSDYNWNPSTDYTTPVYGPVGVVRPQPQPIVDWSARAEPIRDNSSGARRPGILLQWDGDQEDIDAVIFEVRLASTLDVIYTGRTDTPEKGEIHIGQNLLPNVQYGVRGRYVASGNNRPMEWSSWLVVTTDNVLLGEEDIYFPGLVEEVTESVRDAMEFIDTRSLLEEAQRLMNSLADQDAGNFIERESIRTELKVTAGGLTASYTQAIDAAVGPDSAIVQELTRLTVELDGKANADVVQLLQTQVTVLGEDVTAVANALTQTNAQVGRFSASGLFRASSEASGSGAVSRVVLAAEASAGANSATAAIFLEALSNGQNRVGILASQFYVYSAANQLLRPFIIQDGVVIADNLRVAWAKITDVQITNAQIANLTVGTSNLDFNAVTQTTTGVCTAYSQQWTVPPGSGGALVQTWPVSTITVPPGVGSQLSTTGTLQLYVGAGSRGRVSLVIRNATTGVLVYRSSYIDLSPSGGTGGTGETATSPIDTYQIDPSLSSAANNTYQLYVETEVLVGYELRFSFTGPTFKNLLWKR
ncbi:phage tail protein [Limoniibacter endophyticus]|uniref:Tip attachment protein J domain-containing protein n=1 Tax=Limoniibacter endophyticus TaxID=1565040 RepID=A0A8J3DJJ9_9HYPH|nr:phage tail protein [Limoniibacter endophyticus]GHC61672.1 hypothetical protein GCM10010136_02360 [Limoniibacter endophyticus]